MAKRKKLHAKHALSSEELKRDRFLEVSAQIFNYVRKRKEWFIFGLIGVIALVSFGNRYLIARERSHSQAEFQLTLAHQYLLNGDYASAATHYETIAQQYANTRQGREAQYWLGEAQFSSGMYDEAIGAYERFMSSSSRDDILFPSALASVAACHEAKGNHAEAAGVYRRICDEFRKSSLACWTCLQSGILYEKAGEYRKAEEGYTIVTEKFADSFLALEAKQRLIFLRGEQQAKGLETQ